MNQNRSLETKYNKIGNNYNSTRRADPYLVEKIMEHLNPKQEGIYLEIGCGTGNYTLAIEKRGIQLIGIDPSEKMLDVAKRKSNRVDWRLGQVEQLKLPDNSIDGAFGFLTIHHWADLQQGLSELGWVLKPRGKLVIFTSTPKQMKGYWLNHYFPKMLQDSIIQMPSFELVKEAMLNSAFTIKLEDNYFVKPDLQDQFLYCGKQNPEMYFDKQIRNGISSFSALANREEVEKGLAQLQEDMDSGEIQRIIDRYSNNLGDYLFVVAEKKESN